jgi:hypothetical protein
MAERRATPEDRADESGRNDLLTLGLLVYFVALIVLVAGLLILPAIF